MLLALGERDADPASGRVDAAIAAVASAPVFFAGKDAAAGGTPVRAGAPAAMIGGQLIAEATLSELLQAVVRKLAGNAEGVVTLYYGGRQKERDAARFAAELGAAFPAATVEYYFGGQADNEYWVSFEA